MEKMVFEAKVPTIRNMGNKNYALWLCAFAMLILGLFGFFLFSPVLCLILCIAGVALTCFLLFSYCKGDCKDVRALCNISLIADKDTIRWMLKKHEADKYGDLAGYDLENEYVAIGDVYVNRNEFSAKMFNGERMKFFFEKDEDREKLIEILKKLDWEFLVSRDPKEYF